MSESVISSVSVLSDDESVEFTVEERKQRAQLIRSDIQASIDRINCGLDALREKIHSLQQTAGRMSEVTSNAVLRWTACGQDSETRKNYQKTNDTNSETHQPKKVPCIRQQPIRKVTTDNIQSGVIQTQEVPHSSHAPSEAEQSDTTPDKDEEVVSPQEDETGEEYILVDMGSEKIIRE